MPCELVLFSKENFFSSSSFYVKFEKYIYMLIHQDGSIEETLQFHGWELRIFLLFSLKHILLWKLTLPLWRAMPKGLLRYDSFGTVFDSWWSGYFDIYPLYKRFLKENLKKTKLVLISKLLLVNIFNREK